METIFSRAFAELNAPQLAALQTLRKHKLMAMMMPRQVGKTHFGVWVNREIMRQNSNAQTTFLAKDFPSITRATREKFLKLFPSDEFDVSINGVRHPHPTQKSQRGASYFTGVDRAPSKIRGGTFAYFHWSEVAFSQFQGGISFKEILETVVLPTISRTQGLGLLESTPFGSNFWKEFWEEKNAFAKVKFPLDLCIELGAITQAQADFMHRTLHPDMFTQEMLIEFISFMGKIYREFVERHETYVAPIEAHEHVIVGLDIGVTAAFCALFGVWRTNAITGRKRLEIFDQIHEKGLRKDQMAKLVFDRLRYHNIDVEQPGERRRVSCYSDHDQEVIDELRKLKVPVELADKLNTFACRLDLRSAFHFDQIVVEPHKCLKLKRELQSASWDPKKIDEMYEGGDPNKGHWDSESALRYLWRGSKLEVPVPEKEPEHVNEDVNAKLEWDLGAERRAARAAKYQDDKRPREGVDPDDQRPQPGQIFEY